MRAAAPKSLLTLEPIGVIHTQMRVKFDAPSQPVQSSEQESVIELFPGRGFERALQDLNGFDRVWLLWWFHRNSTWRPLVRPPRGDGTKRGVFATRSPHRPNPLGISAVPLLQISGLTLQIGSSDLVDGTPILDIKPYLSSVDSFPNASSGWLAEIEAQHSCPPEYTVSFLPPALAQLQWLREGWGIDFISRAVELLQRDPSPHRTRRISSCGGGRLRMGCGPWRVFLTVAGKQVLIERITPGYPPRLLHSQDACIKVPDREAQIAFAEQWPDGMGGNADLSGL